MDPSVAQAISQVLGPFLGVLACGANPVTLVFLSKHFKLRTRELDLQAELQETSRPPALAQVKKSRVD